MLQSLMIIGAAAGVNLWAHAQERLNFHFNFNIRFAIELCLLEPRSINAIYFWIYEIV